MKKLNKKYEGWDSTQHLNEFDLWNNLSSHEFRYRWGSFLENKILAVRRTLSTTSPCTNSMMIFPI